jgi:hypothetical protein
VRSALAFPSSASHASTLIRIGAGRPWKTTTRSVYVPPESTPEYTGPVGGSAVTHTESSTWRHASAKSLNTAGPGSLASATAVDVSGRPRFFCPPRDWYLT